MGARMTPEQMATKLRAHKANQPTWTPRDGNDWPDDPPEPTGPHVPPWRPGDPLHEYRRFVCVACLAGFSTPEPLEAHAEYTGHGGAR